MRTPPCRCRARPFYCQEAERKEDRDPAEKMVGTLGKPVGGDCERKPAHECGREREIERAEPGVSKEAARDHRGQEQQVPRDHRPEKSLERPEGKAEGPAAERDLRLDERLETVRIPPRSTPGRELVAEEPEAVDHLAVISRCGLPVSSGAACEVRRPE